MRPPSPIRIITSMALTKPPARKLTPKRKNRCDPLVSCLLPHSQPGAVLWGSAVGARLLFAGDGDYCGAGYANHSALRGWVRKSGHRQPGFNIGGALFRSLRSPETELQQ